MGSRLSAYECLLFAEAVVWTGLARLAILILPFRYLVPLLGARNEQTPQGRNPAPVRRQLTDIACAINRADRYTPWQSKCLVQAITGKFMQARRGIESTLYLGVAKDKENNLMAHAWLRCGNRIVCGGGEMRGFREVLTFGEIKNRYVKKLLALGL